MYNWKTEDKDGGSACVWMADGTVCAAMLPEEAGGPE